jgi:hypothetical protein
LKVRLCFSFAKLGNYFVLTIRQILCFNNLKPQDGIVSYRCDFVDMLWLSAVSFFQLLCDVVMLLLQFDDVLFKFLFVANKLLPNFDETITKLNPKG